MEKLCIGRDTLALDGIVHQLYPGALIEPLFGFAPDDPASVYQLSKRTCIWFVFDEDGKGCGEHAYSNGPTTPADLVPVAPELVPRLSTAIRSRAEGAPHRRDAAGKAARALIRSLSAPRQAR